MDNFNLIDHAMYLSAKSLKMHNMHETMFETTEIIELLCLKKKIRPHVLVTCTMEMWSPHHDKVIRIPAWAASEEWRDSLTFTGHLQGVWQQEVELHFLFQWKASQYSTFGVLKVLAFLRECNLPLTESLTSVDFGMKRVWQFCLK